MYECKVLGCYRNASLGIVQAVISYLGGSDVLQITSNVWIVGAILLAWMLERS